MRHERYQSDSREPRAVDRAGSLVTHGSSEWAVSVGKAKGPSLVNGRSSRIDRFRLDCGNAGAVYLTEERARDVIDELKRWVR